MRVATATNSRPCCVKSAPPFTDTSTEWRPGAAVGDTHSSNVESCHVALTTLDAPKRHLRSPVRSKWSPVTRTVVPPTSMPSDGDTPITTGCCT